MSMTFYYHDLPSLQTVLEEIAQRSNSGACETYNYCQYCEEPKCIIRKSHTPCADAFLKAGLCYVRTKTQDPLCDTHTRFVKYQKLEEQKIGNKGL